jgi:serine/threonine protein phosphatase 1
MRGRRQRAYLCIRMSRLIAIGDIHGCSRTFDKLVNEVIGLTRSDELILLGDYIDRGPDSKGVVDMILDLRASGFSVHTLRGNHEQLMLESVLGDNAYMGWLINGGDTTLASFGEPAFDLFEPRYVSFFEDTHFCLMRNRYIFVHAGINFQAEFPYKDHHAMLWTRETLIDPVQLGDRIIVHGHTPKPLPTVVNPPDHRIINLDAGCVYKGREDMGYLVAYEPAAGAFLYTENIDM